MAAVCAIDWWVDRLRTRERHIHIKQHGRCQQVCNKSVTPSPQISDCINCAMIFHATVKFHSTILHSTVNIIQNDKPVTFCHFFIPSCFDTWQCAACDITRTGLPQVGFFKSLFVALVYQPIASMC